MEIEFTSSIEQAVDFNLYEYQTNTFYQEKITQERLQGLSLLYLFGIILSIALDHHLIFRGLIITLLLCILIYLYSWFTFVKTTRGRLKIFYNNPDNDGFWGKVRVIISPDSIVDEMPFGTTKVFWGSVKKIIEEKKYVYIYYAFERTIIIPNEAFINDEERKKFLEIANGYWKEAHEKQ